MSKTGYCAAVAICCCTLAAAADNPDRDKQSISDVDAQYIRAFGIGDAEAAARLFSDDAIYVTEDGRTLKGRPEINQALAQQFAVMRDADLELVVYSIDVSPDRQSAIEHGLSIVREREGEMGERSSYVAEFSRDDDNRWKISRVVESPQAASAGKLKELAWMIGFWNDKSDDASITMDTQWGLDRGFILRKFDIAATGRRDLKGIEYIGWDPVRQEIHSWYFDSDGGYGGGEWRSDGNRWVVKTVGITPHGETAGATQIFTRKDDNTYTWRSVNREVNGKALADVPEVTVQRNSMEASAERGSL